MYIKKISQTPELQATVADNLNSDSAIDALSARQGKILNEKSAIISLTEPTTGENIWLKKGKNLIKSFRKGVNYNETTNEYQADVNFIVTDLIEVQLNASYVFSHSIATSQGSIVCLDGNQNYVESINIESITTPFIITNSNVKYIVVKAFNLNGALNEEWMQLEQNTVATAYEEYVEPAIYVKNNNGVFEEFIKKDNLVNYSLGEQRIGTWVDGKPLYRKTIYIDSLPNAGIGYYNIIDDVSILDTVFIDDSASYLRESVEILPLNHIWNTETYVMTSIYNKQLRIVTTGDKSNGHAYVTVKYTKTTN